LGSELVACAAGRAFAGAGPDAEEVLGRGGVEAWVAVEGAGCGVGVAVGGAEGVAFAVAGGGNFVSWG